MNEAGGATRTYVSMARPPPHRIELTEDERGVLERRARAQKLPFQQVQLADRALRGRRHGDTDIAALMDSSPGLVARWRRRFA